MSNINAVIQIIAGLTGLAADALFAVQKYNAMMALAASEGRDITDAELDALRAENQDLTDTVASKLL